MADAQPRPMTEAEYLAWEAKQEEKHEFIDGRPVRKWPVRPGETEAKAGATNRHNQIMGEVSAALKTKLRGGRCAAFSPDTKVMLSSGRYRYPDVSVQCAPADPLEHFISEPAVLFEVLSPSNSWFERTRRLEDDQRLESVRHIVVLAQDEPRAQVWTRGDAGWTREEHAGLEAALTLPAVDVTLAFTAVYEDVAFEAV